MAAITTRQTGATAKGSPLSNAEVDQNFINLNAAVQPSGGTQGQVLVKASATDYDSQWVTNSAGDVTLNGTQTLTNKRITSRIVSVTSASTITPDANATDQYVVTAQAVALTVAAPTGTPTDGQKLIFRIEGSGTAQTITWNSTYRAVGITLPTTTAVGKALYVGAIYNSQDTFWDIIAVALQA